MTALPLFAAVAAAGLAFALAQGLSYPLLSILQEQWGYSAFFIGVSAAMTPLGLLVSSPFTPRVVARFPAQKVVTLCCALVVALYVLMGLWQHWLVWLVARFLLGVLLNPVFMMAEVWTLSLAPAGQQGRYVAVLSMVMQAGFAGGPAILAVTGVAGFTPFAVCTVAFILCMMIIVTARGLPDISKGHAPDSPFRMIRVAPVLLAAVAVTAGFEQGVLSLLPVYAGGHGYDAETAAWLLTVMVGGSIAVTPVAGWMAERIGARRSMVWLAMVAALGAPFLSVLIGTPLVWPYLALWGGTYFGIYTVALVEAGERFSGPSLVALNAAIGIMWGIGGMTGGPSTGAAMDLFGPEALPAMFTLFFGGLALAAWMRSRGRAV